MSRTPKVEAALAWADCTSSEEQRKLLGQTADGTLSAYVPRVLGNEVLRLEALCSKQSEMLCNPPVTLLYRAIVARLEPHFPACSRGLEWDVLPSTIGALAQRAETAEARVKELERCLTVEQEDNRELRADLADLRNAGGLPFIRSQAIRNLKADLEAEKQENAKLKNYIAQDHAVVEMLEEREAKLRAALEDVVNTRYCEMHSYPAGKCPGCIAREALAETKGTP
jgi:hypothetical protein